MAAAVGTVTLMLAPAARAEDPLITDRPDFTESAFVVDRGRWQFEAGATWGDGANVTTVFVELYGFNREQARGSGTFVFQTGITHLLSPNLQLDARAARRLTNDGPDLPLGIGAAWRY